jgi:hypothetical protein
MKGIWREHQGYMKGIFRSHEGHMKRTWREHEGNMKGTWGAHEGNMKNTERAHEGHMKGTWRAHSWNIQGTWRAHEGHMRGTWREHEGHIQGSIRAHSGNIQGTFGEHLGNTPSCAAGCSGQWVWGRPRGRRAPFATTPPEQFREHSVNIHWTFSEHLGNNGGTFREHSGNIQCKFRANSRNTLLMVWMKEIQRCCRLSMCVGERGHKPLESEPPLGQKRCGGVNNIFLYWCPSDNTAQVYFKHVIRRLMLLFSTIHELYVTGEVPNIADSYVFFGPSYYQTDRRP